MIGDGEQNTNEYGNVHHNHANADDGDDDDGDDDDDDDDDENNEMCLKKPFPMKYETPFTTTQK